MRPLAFLLLSSLVACKSGGSDAPEPSPQQTNVGGSAAAAGGPPTASAQPTAGAAGAGSVAGTGGGGAKPWTAASGGSTNGSADRWHGWKSETIGGCQLYFAPAPVEALVSPLTWQPCPGMAGCLVMDVPWWDGKGSALNGPSTAAIDSAGERWLGIRRQLASGVRLAAIHRLSTGAPVLAWGIDGCSGGDVKTLDMLGNRAVTWASDYSAGHEDVWVYLLDNAPRESVPMAVVKTGASTLGGFFDARAGDGRIVWKFGYADLDDGQIHRKVMAKPSPWGRSIFYEKWSGIRNEIWLFHENKAEERFFGDEVHSYFSATTDGETLVWAALSQPFVSDDGSTVYRRADVMASPYTIDRATLVPRVVMTVLNEKGHVGFEMPRPARGHLLVAAGNKLRIVRLSDGQWYERPEAPVPSLRHERHFYVDDSEYIGQLADGVRERTLMRVKLSSLELHPPEIMPAP